MNPTVATITRTALGLDGSATFSACESYRYMLGRTVNAKGRGTCLFVMLNPSTATEEKNDPTVRRCIGFAERWGYGSLFVGNVYGLRATDPRELWRAEDPVGPDNDHFLATMAQEADCVIAAWGTHAKDERARQVMALLRQPGRRVQCLGVTKAGCPKHPLYLPNASRRRAYSIGG